MARLSMRIALAFWFSTGLRAAAELRVLHFPVADTLAKRALEQRLSSQLEAEVGYGIDFVPIGEQGTQAALDTSRSEIALGNADVVVMDVIDPGELDGLLAPIEDAGVPSDIIDSILPNTFDDVRTPEGKHMGMPFFNDFGLLYYRKDLLLKYNFSLPPREGWTFDEMEEIARYVQERERQHSAVFDGFVWQGGLHEGLTCVAVEVVSSYGTATLLDKDGNVTVNSPAYRAAMDRLLGWLHGRNGKAPISPLGEIVIYRGGDIVQRFCWDRNAMFARQWPGMIGACNNAGMAGKFGVVRNPGPVRGAGRGTQGGAMLAVPSTSSRKTGAGRFISDALKLQSQLDFYSAHRKLSPRIDMSENASLCQPSPTPCLLNAGLLSGNVSQHLPAGDDQYLLVLPSAPGCEMDPNQATWCDVDMSNYIAPRPSSVAKGIYRAISAKYQGDLNRLMRLGLPYLEEHIEMVECETMRMMRSTAAPSHRCHTTWAAACAAGMSWNPISHLCEPCPVGTSSQAGGNCTPCLRGFSTSAKGSSQCVPCAAGSVAMQEGSVQCELCKAGSYSNSTTLCLPCPKSTTSQRGSTSVGQCFCPSGTYLVAGSSGMLPVCEECPEGVFCPGSDPTGTFSEPQQEAGYWVDPASPRLDVFRCRNDRECPAGELGTCAANREGRACSRCVDGYITDNGPCKPCSTWHGWPLLFAAVIAIIFGIVVSLLYPIPGRARLDMLATACTAAHMVVMIQALGSLLALSIEWRNPTSGILQFCTVFTIDTDTLRIGCVAGVHSPVMRYICTLLAYPAGFSLVALSCWCVRRHLRTQEVSTADLLINLHGMILCSLATSLSLRSVEAFACTPNPNGSLSLATDPGIVCWESDEHKIITALSVLGILAYPVACLTWICSIIRGYPALVRSGQSYKTFHRHAFLFARFTNKAYWYGLPYVFRSLVMGLLPSLLAGMPYLQIFLVGAVVLSACILGVCVWPWKAYFANVGDMLACCAIVCLLMGAGPLVRTDGYEIGPLLPAVLFICVASVFIFGSVSIMYFLFRIWMSKVKNRVQYDLFMCHQKQSSGAFCRLMKMTLAKHYASPKVFVEEESLLCLAEVVDIARYQSKQLVVMLSRSLITSPWRLAEIAAAMSGGVPTVPVLFDVFSFPSDEKMAEIPVTWSSEEQHTLLSSGVTMSAVQSALSSIRTITPTRIPHIDEETKLLDAAAIFARHSGLRPLRTWPLVCAEPTDAGFLIVADNSNLESFSTAFLLAGLLQGVLSLGGAVATSPDQLKGESLQLVVVLLSRGAEYDVNFRRCALSLIEEVSTGRGIRVAAVVNDPAFVFGCPEEELDNPDNPNKGVQKGHFTGGCTDASTDSGTLQIHRAFGGMTQRPFLATGTAEQQQASVLAIARKHECVKLRSAWSFKAEDTFVKVSPVAKIPIRDSL